jgi:hypothetical protein
MLHYNHMLTALLLLHRTETYPSSPKTKHFRLAAAAILVAATYRVYSPIQLVPRSAGLRMPPLTTLHLQTHYFMSSCIRLVFLRKSRVWLAFQHDSKCTHHCKTCCIIPFDSFPRADRIHIRK